MKKFHFEAVKRQWEKPTEPKQYLCATAKLDIIAEDEATALEMAKKQFHDDYFSSGTVLGEVKLAGVSELPVDWNYGYCEGRKAGNEDDKAALRKECTK